MTISIRHVCRGFGYGHASRASKIIGALRRADAGCTIATGGTGAEFFRKNSRPFTDLKWRDRADHGRWTVRKVRNYLTAACTDTDLVVADELFYVPAICSGLGLPSVFMACAVTSHNYHQIESAVASGDTLVLVPDWPEVHRLVSRDVRDRVRYVGPVVDSITCTRAEARQTVGLNADCELWVLALGAIHPSKFKVQRNMLQQCLTYWRELNSPDRRLVVLCAEDVVRHYFGMDTRLPRVEWWAFAPQAPLVYRGADVVFAYGGSSALESMYQRTPTVAFASGHPVDTKRIAHLSDHGALAMRTSNESESLETLAADVEVARRCSTRTLDDFPPGDPARIAAMILDHLSSWRLPK